MSPLYTKVVIAALLKVLKNIKKFKTAVVKKFFYNPILYYAKTDEFIEFIKQPLLSKWSLKGFNIIIIMKDK